MEKESEEGKKFSNSINEAIRSERRIEALIASDPDLLEYIKRHAWFAVQYASKLEQSKLVEIVKKEHIEEFVSYELGLSEKLTYDPYRRK